MDEKLIIAKETERAMQSKVRETTVRKELLASQIDNLEEGLLYHGASQLPRFGSNAPEKAQGEDSQGVRALSETNFLTTVSKYVTR